MNFVPRLACCFRRNIFVTYVEIQPHTFVHANVSHDSNLTSLSERMVPYVGNEVQGVLGGCISSKDGQHRLVRVQVVI